jgi:hypothetical protein
MRHERANLREKQKHFLSLCIFSSENVIEITRYEILFFANALFALLLLWQY